MIHTSRLEEPAYIYSFGLRLALTISPGCASDVEVWRCKSCFTLVAEGACSREAAAPCMGGEMGGEAGA